MHEEIINKIDNWNTQIRLFSVEDKIEFVLKKIEGKKVFSTSFGIEDQFLTHILYPHFDQFSIFTLDTERQFEETYQVFQKTIEKYNNYKIETFFPEENDVKEYVFSDGINGFYNSVESRKKCCFVRKVKPLKRAIKGANLWITGLRAEQSMNRENMNFLEWDAENELIKFNPLLDYSLNDVAFFVKQHNIPINSLYDKGYPSIGCAPCTRAISKDEDFRAGRWWWENGKKECGLHINIEKNN